MSFTQQSHSALNGFGSQQCYLWLLNWIKYSSVTFTSDQGAITARATIIIDASQIHKRLQISGHIVLNSMCSAWLQTKNHTCIWYYIGLRSQAYLLRFFFLCRYYVGRKCMFENDFKSADEYLTFAFERCHRSSKANKRLILISLLPVKMLMVCVSMFTT